MSGRSNDLLGKALEGQGPVVDASGASNGGASRGVAAPVSSSAGVIGAIYSGFEPPSGLSRDHLIWATDCYAQLAALCMSGDDLTLSTAIGSSGFDPLTGCLTYAAAVDVLRAEGQRSRRRGHRLALCMLDLDGFKRVNDERGHIEGNRVLSLVGAALRSVARRYDTVGRFGGDEFMIVLPETGGHDAARIAERFLAGAQSAIRSATPVPLDASLGVAEWDGESSPMQLLDRADRVMRGVKRAGGGRVESEPSTHEPVDGFTELSRHMFGPFRADSADREDRPAV